MDIKIINIFLELSKIYNDIGDKFRSLAYSKAIIAIKNGNKRNIGASIQKKIEEIQNTGKLQLLQDLRENPIIKQKRELTKINGITDAFIKKNNIKSINDLYKIKDKLTNAQKLGLDYYEELQEKIPRTEMKNIFTKIKNKLNPLHKSGLIQKIELVGSYRRNKPASKDVDILIVANKDFKNISKIVINLLKNDIIGTFASGVHKFNGVIATPRARHLDIMFTKPIEYPAALMAFTGSADFNRIMRLKAIERGMKLNEKGLFKGTKRISIKTEEDIFKKLKLKYIKPELR